MPHRFLAVTPFGPATRARFPELIDVDRFRTLPPDGLDSWDSLLDRLGDWPPEVLVLDLPHRRLPDGLVNPPVPVVGILTEARKFWHTCRADLGRCDALLVDALPATLPAEPSAALLPQRGSWSAHLEFVVCERTGRREAGVDPVASLLGRVLLALDEPERSEGKILVEEVASLLARRPRDSRLLNALAALTYRLARPGDGQAVGRVRDLLAEARDAEPENVLAVGNLIDLALEMRRDEEAIALAERGLRMLDRSEAARLLLDPPIHLRATEALRREWDEAAWNATSPESEDRAKRTLVRGYLHTVLAALTNRLPHFTEAAIGRPNSPAVRAALGCALAREGRLAESTGHLRFAVEADPFDLAAARALGRVYEDLGLTRPLRDLQVSRCDLAAKYPERVPTEPWFAEAFPLPPADPIESLAIAWQGDFNAVHSLARVNRAITAKLAERGHRVASLPTDAERFAPIAEPSVHVTHHWPPLWSPPASGHWVVMQPWEYSLIPASWVGELDRVDEVWVPAKSVKEAFVRSGVPEDRVFVVPLGVDSDRFRPDGERYPLKTGKRFRFLFVGGTIERKGFDLLLNAYAETFTAEDDVCLVVKDMGTDTFYRGQTAGAWVADLRSRPGAPEVEYLDAALSEAELAALYRACDCLVAPFRGEGFALPVAEAMASGLPVVVTEAGPVLDYCDSRFAWFVPAGQETFPKEQLGAFAPAVDPNWAALDPTELRRLLRRVFESTEEVRKKGEAARAYAAEHLTWTHAAARVEERVRELRTRPVRRSRPALIPAPIPEARPYRGAVSLCLIVRNEEANLGACLESARGLFDETVVVDTGSTDGTKEIATRMGARVFDFSWIDDFAAARNESLRHATGDWVFWMDADDRLGPDDRDRLRALIRSLRDENAAYVLKCSCTPGEPGGAAVVVDHVRLFRNDPRLRWKYRVHEQILPAVRRTGGEVRWSDVVVEHVGYRDPALRRRKLQRDLQLLKREEQEQPDDPFTLFNLGSVYQELGELTEAIRALQRSLRGSDPRDSIVRKIYALLTQCHRELGESDAALAACREGRGHYPRDAELLFLESLLRRQRGETDAAVACLEELLATQEEPHFASVDPSLRGVKAHHNLAILRFESGVRDRAETHWRSALALDENFLPAWLGLAEVHLREGNREEIEKIIARLERLPTPGPFEAFRLRVRRRTESGDVEGAEQG